MFGNTFFFHCLKAEHFLANTGTAASRSADGKQAGANISEVVGALLQLIF